MGCCGGGHRSGNHGRSENGHGSSAHQDTHAKQSGHVNGNKHDAMQMADYGHGKRKSKFWSLFSFNNHASHH